MFKLAVWQHKKAGVLGLGKSGRAVAELLAAHHIPVLISEDAPVAHVKTFSPGIEVETGGHSEKLFACDFWIKSPGMSPHSPVLLEARKRQIPVFSELEVAIAFMPKKVRVFAVTGTNGKTTTTALLGEILKADAAEKLPKRNVFVCGNIGNPISHIADKVQPGDDIVVEVSSYQLEDSTYFRPHVACLLNITPDHLEHHGGMRNYIKAKGKICKNQRSNDIFVVNGADVSCAELAEKAKSRVLAFSTYPKHLLKTNVFFDGDELIFSEGQQLRPPQLKGMHNIENAMAAALMALSAGVMSDTIQRVFDNFKAMEHRIEQFAYHRGVVYVNDSKATNLDSTITALKSFDKCNNIWLILGGRDKGASYEILLPYLKDYCKRVLTIGEAMDKIERELNGYPVVRCETLENAVDAAMKNAQKGDIVLLSPACASFDQFKSFEDRGRVFKRLVDARIFKDRTSSSKK
ncbi:UDP-N-acetylmuramoyl-L-alanine--D-glutamate ligase [Candidatus Avelusimicrobium luingense]|uniref:UDP-N-acetylmuramoyl-L-alanine--D-glutamate ligase n=1 Tax=Candidatus Avelusimicrobium luingense TaxID=3416211 RepID=UPI003D14589E